MTAKPVRFMPSVVHPFDIHSIYLEGGIAV
jgi:hypothetical protein